jgi:hypothetical protein
MGLLFLFLAKLPPELKEKILEHIRIQPKLNGECPNFRNNHGIEYVILSNKIKVIPSKAFSGCCSLKWIYFSLNIITIEDYSFEKCTNLEFVDLSRLERLTSIGKYSFEECDILRYVIFPRSLKVIRFASFRSCQSLKTVDLRKSRKLQMIGRHAFINCSSLEKVYFPASLEKIRHNAFENCEILTHVEVAPNNKLKTIEKEAFKNCSELESVFYAPRIGDGVFDGCPKFHKKLKERLG